MSSANCGRSQPRRTRAPAQRRAMSSSITTDIFPANPDWTDPESAMPFPLTSVAVGVPEMISAVVTSMVVVCDSVLASEPMPAARHQSRPPRHYDARARQDFPTMKPFFCTPAPAA